MFPLQPLISQDTRPGGVHSSAEAMGAEAMGAEAWKSLNPPSAHSAALLMGTLNKHSGQGPRSPGSQNPRALLNPGLAT